jgi:hypothetical protein
MKLFNLRLTTLKSTLYAIVFASFVVRAVAFFVLPSTPSSLGPDEGTYGALAKWTEQGLPATEFPLYGAGLYQSARSLVWPAAMFIKLGIDPLQSIRLTATIYGLLSVWIVVFVFLKTLDFRAGLAEYVSKKSVLVTSIFAVFAFLPSHFIWSLLGLRESAIEFWTLCALISLYWIFHFHKKLSLKSSILLIASIVFAFSSRPQVGWVIVFAILIFLLINIRKRTALALIPLVLVGLVLGFMSTTDTTDKSGTTGTTDKSGTTGTTDKSGTTGVITSTGGKIFGSLASAAQLTAYKHQANQLAAESTITTQRCPLDGLAYTNRPPSSFDTYFCIAWRAPYMAATFLFRPLIFIDTTSTSSLFAAIENIAWLGAFIFIVVMLIKKRRLAFVGPLVPSLIFFVLYCVGAGSYEGNMGTAFRHKSLILWVILLLLASVIVAEKRPNSRNESAQKGV